MADPRAIIYAHQRAPRPPAPAPLGRSNGLGVLPIMLRLLGEQKPFTMGKIILGEENMKMAQPKRGRPPGSGEGLTRFAQTQLTPDEHEQMAAKAKSQGLSMAAFIRIAIKEKL